MTCMGCFQGDVFKVIPDRSPCHFHCEIVPLSHCTIEPLYYCGIVLLWDCTIVPLRNFTILQFRNHSIPHFHNPTIPRFHNGTISQCYNETTLRARRACSRMPHERAELRLGGHGGGEVRHDLFHTMSLENTRARPSSERMIQYLNPRNSDCGDRSACTRDLVPSVGFMR